MPHPEQEHALMIEVARLRKERDEALSREARLAAANKALAADVTRCAGIESALAAARRECEGLRKALHNIVGVWKEIHDDAKQRRMWILGWETWLSVIAAGAALAAPAAGEEGKR